MSGDREAALLAKVRSWYDGADDALTPARKKWDGSKMTVGGSDRLSTPRGRKVRGHYVLVEADVMTPSHDPGNGYAQSEGYPKDKNGNTPNDRDYEHDNEAQKETERIAGSFDEQAVNNIVWVSREGIVLSGNGRMMAGQMAARQGTDGAYVDYVREHASKWGFTPEQVSQYQHPRVVFVPEERLPYTTETFAEFNGTGMKGKSPVERTIEMGKRVSDESFGRIMNLMSGHDSADAAMGDANTARAILSELNGLGIISNAQMTEFVDLSTGAITAAGRALIEETLIGKAFGNNPEAVRRLNLMPGIRKKVVTALKALADNRQLEERFRLEAELSTAIELLERAHRDHGGSVEAAATQLALGEESTNLERFQNPRVVMLAELLQGKKIRTLRDVLREYNGAARNGGVADLFSGETASKEGLIEQLYENHGEKSKFVGKLLERERKNSERSTEDESVDGGDGEGAGVGEFKREKSGEPRAERDVKGKSGERSGDRATEGKGAGQASEEKREAAAGGRLEELESELAERRKELAEVEDKLNYDPNDERLLEEKEDIEGQIESLEFQIEGERRRGTGEVSGESAESRWEEPKGGEADSEETDGGNEPRDEETTELTIEEIEESDLDDAIKTGALAYLEGDWGMMTQIAYNAAKEYVRDRQQNSERDSGDADGSQLGGFDNEASGAPDGGGGRPDTKVATGGDSEALSGDGAGRTDSSDGMGASTGGTGDSGVRGGASSGSGLSAGSGKSSRGGVSGGKGTNVRGRGGRRGGRRDAVDASGEPSVATAGAGQALVDAGKANIAAAQDMFRDILARMKKDGSQPHDIVELSARLGGHTLYAMAATARLGFGLLQMGVGKFVDWLPKMKEHLDEFLRKGVGLDDRLIDEYIREMWEYPFKVNGETHKLREWADILSHQELREEVGKSIEEKRKAQSEATKEVKHGDIENINEALPFLLPKQREDVQKAETQFWDESHKDAAHGNGKGILFTNATGTGKTYTGLGVVRRFLNEGKGRILIVTAQDTKIQDWIKDAKNLGIEAKMLEDTSSKGEGVVVTQYANLRANYKLCEDDFDLIIYDESHKLMQNQYGQENSTSRMHHMIANRDVEQAIRRGLMGTPLFQRGFELMERIDDLRDLKEKSAAELSKDERDAIRTLGGKEGVEAELKRLNDELEATYAEQDRVLEESLSDKEKVAQAQASVERTKVVFLSATPFNTALNLDYVESYIFSYPESKAKDSTREKRRAAFILDKFPGSHRRGKDGSVVRRTETQITDPAKVNEEERGFSDYLQNELGTMSGRVLDSEYDYSRTFPRVDAPGVSMVNKAISDLTSGKYNSLSEHFEILNNYATSTAFYEVVKTAASIERIKEHLSHGRKVLLYHRRKSSSKGLEPPFAAGLRKAAASAKSPEEMALIESFAAEYRELLEWESKIDYRFPHEQLMEAFATREEKAAYSEELKEWQEKVQNTPAGKRAPKRPQFKSAKIGVYNGGVSNQAKMDTVRRFNDDESGMNVMVVQVDAGKEGISLHDVTGKHQRVMLSLFLPQSPIEFIQTEGRIFRVGNKSDAVFEYVMLGVDHETASFAAKINGRSQTSENLALGSGSRALRDSISRGVLSSRPIPVTESMGVGGKRLDSQVERDKTDYDRSVQDWRKRTENGKRGLEVLPEPIGYKMLEWCMTENGETVLIPYAGEGETARYAPVKARLVALESDMSKYSQLAARVGGAGRKIEQKEFDDYHRSNKADVIVLAGRHGEGPHVGAFGAIANDYADYHKALSHLEESGRLVMVVDDAGLRQIKGESQDDFAIRMVLTLDGEHFGENGVRHIVVTDRVSRAQRGKVGNRVDVDLYGERDANGVIEVLRTVEVPERMIDKAGKIIKGANSQLRELKGCKAVASQKNWRTKKMEPVVEVVDGRLYIKWQRDAMSRLDISVDGEITGRWQSFSIYPKRIANGDFEYIQSLAREYLKYGELLEADDHELCTTLWTSQKNVPVTRDALVHLRELYKALLGKTDTQLRNIAEGRLDNEIPERDLTLQEYSDIFDGLNGKDVQTQELGYKVLQSVKRIDGMTFACVPAARFRGERNTVAHYIPGENRIELNSGWLNSMRMRDAQKAQTMVHEMIHAVTSWAIDTYERSPEKLTSAQRGAVEDILEVYNSVNTDEFRGELQLRSELKDNAEYGLESVHEMIAELANPVFRAVLRGKKLWRQMINGVKRLLGMDVTGDGSATTAEKVLSKALDTLMENFDERVYAQYTGGMYGKEVRYESAMGDGSVNFQERRERAVENRGTVMPGLDEAEVNVVTVPRHGYHGRDILRQAVDNAASRYAGKVLTYNNYGVTFDYEITKKGLTYSANHVSKSDNLGIHAAVMDKLDKVIGESIEVMEHADVRKVNGLRSEDNGYNPDVLMHRFVGAVEIDGKVYRVISTLKEFSGDQLTREHTYEVTKIDVLDYKPSTSNGTVAENNTPLRTAKLLENCEIHNKSGKKLLDESARSGLEANKSEGLTNGEGDDIRYRVREESAPRRTKRVYKLMRLGEDGKLYPLFIDAAAPTELGVWYDADSPSLEMLRDKAPGIYIVNGDTGEVKTREEFNAEHPEYAGRTKYPSKSAIKYATETGQRWVYIESTAREQKRFGNERRKYWNLGINGSGTVSTFSMRPGWHAASLPTMRQIGKGKNKDLRDNRFVWVEGEVSADVDYNAEASKNPDNDLPDRIPENGFYMKATNADASKSQADRVGWYVAGSFKANRIIGDAEARRVIDEYNAAHPDMKPIEYDYPRESGKDYEPEAEADLVSEGEIRGRAEDVAGEIGGSVRVVHGGSDMEHLESYRRASAATRARMRKAKGWYDPVTGEVVVNAGAHRSAEDMARTVLHEEIGHKGLETVMGKEPFERLCDAVFERGDEEVRRGIAELMAKHNYDAREATREYMAKLAEKVERDGVQSLSDGARRIWEALKAQVTKFLGHVFSGMELPVDLEISEKMLSRMLQDVYERRKSEAKGENVTDVFSAARESVRRSEWSKLNERGEGIRFEGEGERPDPDGPKDGKPTEDEITLRKEATADRIEELFDNAVAGEFKGKPIEVGRLTPEGKSFLEKLSGKKMKDNITFVTNPSDLIHIYRRHYGKNEKDSRNIPLTKEDVRNMHEVISTPDDVIYAKERDGQQRDMFFFLKEASDGSYNLMEVYADRKGNLTSKSFFKSKEGVSQRAMLLGESSTLTSVTDGATLLTDAKLPQFFDYPKSHSETDSASTRFSDGKNISEALDAENTLEAKMFKAKMILADRRKDDLQARDAAAKALSRRTRQILGAMGARKKYDKRTLNSLTTMMRVMMGTDLLTPETKSEVAKMLSLVSHSLDRDDIEKTSRGLVELVAKNQERLADASLKKLLKIKGVKLNDQNVRVQGKMDIEGQEMTHSFKEWYKGTSMDELAEYKEQLREQLAGIDEGASMIAAARLIGLE